MFELSLITLTLGSVYLALSVLFLHLRDARRLRAKAKRLEDMRNTRIRAKVIQ